MTRVLALKDSFYNGSFVPKGFLVDVADFSPARDKNFAPANNITALDRVQMSALSPTGPNPGQPQQVPPGTHQTVAGYTIPGAVLVGEVTRPQEERIDAAGLHQADQPGAQAAVRDILVGAGDKETIGTSALLDDDDDLVEGTVAQVVSTLDEKSKEELEAIKAAEQDREVPRKGVLNAIDERLAKL